MICAWLSIMFYLIMGDKEVGFSENDSNNDINTAV